LVTGPEGRYLTFKFKVQGFGKCSNFLVICLYSPGLTWTRLDSLGRRFDHFLEAHGRSGEEGKNKIMSKIMSKNFRRGVGPESRRIARHF
jgi:hypothetical protein